MKKNYTRQQVFDKFGGKCAYCGCDLPVKGWHNDHKEPIVRNWKYEFVNGKNVKTELPPQYPERDCLDNCMPACASCNINKHSDTIEQFRANIAGYLLSLNKYSVQYKMAKKYGLVKETSKPVVFYFETLNPAPGR